MKALSHFTKAAVLVVFMFGCITCSEKDPAYLEGKSGIVFKKPPLWQVPLVGDVEIVHLENYSAGVLFRKDNYSYIMKSVDDGATIWEWQDMGDTYQDFRHYSYDNKLFIIAIKTNVLDLFCIDLQSGNRIYKESLLPFVTYGTDSGYSNVMNFTETGLSSLVKTSYKYYKDKLFFSHMKVKDPNSTFYIAQVYSKSLENYTNSPVCTPPYPDINSIVGIDKYKGPSISQIDQLFSFQGKNNDTYLFMLYCVLHSYKEGKEKWVRYLALYNESQKQWVYDNIPSRRGYYSRSYNTLVFNGDVGIWANNDDEIIDIVDIYKGSIVGKLHRTDYIFEIQDNVLLFVTEGDNEYIDALDSKTCDLLYVNRSNYVNSKIRNLNGVLYWVGFTYKSSILYAMDMKTGKTFWRMGVPDGGRFSPSCAVVPPNNTSSKGRIVVHSGNFAICYETL